MGVYFCKEGIIMASKKLQYAIGNSASTTLAVSASNSDTSMTITSDTNFAAKTGEGMVIVDEGTSTEELAYSTTKSGAVLTTTLANRGLEGGSAQTHSSGATVKGILTAGMWNDLVDSMANVVSTTTGALDTTKVVDLTTAQTLTNKTLTSPIITTPTLTATSSTLTTPKIVTSINDANGNEVIKTPATTSAVNEVTITNSATLTDPTISATGGDDNVGLKIQSKGSGVVRIRGFWDGWVGSDDTWTYASASTFTIAGVDRTTTYTKGTRLKFTQTSVKYAVVVSSSFSTNTTITIAVNTDYTIANAAITLPYYSYEASPAGYPGWFAFVPTAAGFSSDPGIATCRYNIIGESILYHLTASSNGTSNATSLTYTMPAAATYSIKIHCIGRAVDNGSIVATPAMVALTGSSATATFHPSLAEGAWTGSNAKSINFQFEYEF